jgi:hypothetical protein
MILFSSKYARFSEISAGVICGVKKLRLKPPQLSSASPDEQVRAGLALETAAPWVFPLIHLTRRNF